MKTGTVMQTTVKSLAAKWQQQHSEMSYFNKLHRNLLSFPSCRSRVRDPSAAPVKYLEITNKNSFLGRFNQKTPSAIKCNLTHINAGVTGSKMAASMCVNKSRHQGDFHGAPEY